MVLAEKVLIADERDYAAEEQIVHRSKSQPVFQKRSWAITGMLVMAVIVTNLIIQALVIQRDQQLTQLRKMVTVKEEEKIKLRLQIAQLDSFDRIRHIAQTELGMRDAGAQDYLLIKGAPRLIGENSSVGPSTGRSSKQNGSGMKFLSWLGGIGRMMAKSH